MRARSIVVGIALSPFAVAFGCGARTGWVELDERSTADAAPADARATGAPTDTSAPTATPTSTPTSPTSTTTPSTVPTGNVFCVPTSPVPTVTCQPTSACALSPGETVPRCVPGGRPNCGVVECRERCRCLDAKTPGCLCG